jgi:uncharacterized integral membrane protein
MTTAEKKRQTTGFKLMMAFLLGVLLELLIEFARPISRLNPWWEVWFYLKELGDWRKAGGALLAATELYIFLGFLVFAIILVRRGAEYFENEIPSLPRQILFILGLFVAGVLISPHIPLEPDAPCSAQKTIRGSGPVDVR